MQKPVCCDTVPQFGICLGAAVVSWESHFTTFRICKMKALGSIKSAVIFILKFHVAIVRLVVVIILSRLFVPCAFLSYAEKGEAITLLMVSCCPGKYLAKKRFLFFFFFLILFIYLFGCVGSSFLCEGSLQLRQAGTTPHRGARASHRRGPSRYGAQAPDAQAQQLWLTGPAAPRHAGSSQTGARTRVPCIGRQTPNHCTTKEALLFYINKKLLSKYSSIRHGVFSLGKFNSDALIFSDILEYQNK